jgi:hypothetical protein
MSDNKNPTGSNNYSLVDLLPNYYRTDTNKKFIQATIDQLSQKGTAKKLTGYIGRQNAKSATGNDVYIKAPTTARQHYQLEPSVVITDNTGNTTFFKDYQDYINQLKVFGSDVSNHENINRQEFYSWDPHINWDKFVNFQQYYWLPYGPDLITIAGQQLKVTSTYTVSISQSATLQKEYLFTPNGLDRNPAITLYRGQTYYFEINSPGEPFSIKTARTAGSTDRYTDEDYVDNFAVESGTIKFTVPISGPDNLYYLSERNPDLGGLIKFLDITENTYIDVETEVIGKKTYTLSDGTPLSNGMKVAFTGKVSPTQYSQGEYYVEGVGTAINLIPTTTFEIISTYTQDKAVNFDSTLFDQYPFAAATSFTGTPDYITINRSSKDHNPWTRYNRWFHTDVITASAKFNNKLADFDQASRAVRPIIEFEPNLKLFNFGTVATADVDLVDDYTTDVFSIIEGSAGYSVDGIKLTQGMRVAFIADPDINVKNKIYKVSFINIENSGIGVPQIRLVLDESPTVGSNMLVRQGVTYQGQSFWFDGTNWNFGQQKLVVNQAPLFDLFDETGLSFSDYSGSTFAGTKLFSYKLGSTTADTVLGFSLSYQNINNIGDILFEFNLLTDSFDYKDSEILITKLLNTGFLSRLTFANNQEFVNGWQTSLVTRYQPAIRIYKNSGLTNNFPLDIYDNKTDLSDLELRLYVNGRRINIADWTIVDSATYKKIKLSSDIASTDVLTIKSFANQPINNNGHYEVPINLQNNPLNKDMGNFTLGEVTDHLNSIIDNIQLTFIETSPGVNNLSDLGNITPYGTKFVQHSGPASLALYHITSEQNNIVKALEKSRDDYGKFKRSFLLAAKNLGIDTDVVTQVNTILKTLSANKTQQSSYYFSDMVPFTGKKTTEYTVVDNRIRLYPLSSTFNNTTISNKAVSVYLKGTQLLYGIEYSFTADGYVQIDNSVQLANNDTIVVYEYDSTDGCFIPPTPTKLGLWPKFSPKIYVDNSYVIPRTIILGHDGSQVLAYGDYRDDIILELEKRIYNNIQIDYDPTIFDIYDIIPGYFRTSKFTLDEFNKAIAPGFYKWAGILGRDFSKQLDFNKDNTFTYNYKGQIAPDGRNLPGYWRGIYRWMYDTDKPNVAPWEMLGFSEEPMWWQEKYGPAPYTSNNTILWQDLSVGAVSEPGMPVVYRSKFVRPDLLKHLPVDENGNLVSPSVARLATGVFDINKQANYMFGDVAPVESAWRRSSYFPFSTIIASVILQPAHTFATCLDRSRTMRNLCGQLVYKDTNLRVKPQDIVLPSIYSSTTRTYTSGIINYLIEALVSNNFNYYEDYRYNLDNLNVNLSYRLGGFSSKENFNLILDSKNPAATGNVFVPPENYKIVYNSSSPIDKISYSGVIISKVDTGFELKGYSSSESFFKYHPYRQELGPQINVGGISSSFLRWTSGKTYAIGQIVLYSGKYYRTLYTTVAQEFFDSNAFAILPALPITGGVTSIFRRSWDTETVKVLPYGTILSSIQEVVDFLLGYGEHLKGRGFVFEDFNNELSQVSNWETSAKEFMFWTTQKWSSGQNRWEQWTPNVEIKYGQIVKYQDEYYKAVQNISAQPVFLQDLYFKLDGLSTVGSAVISLSPAANKLSFVSQLSVAEDINNPFNDYEIFQVDGSSLLPMDIDSNRQGNLVTFTPANNGTIYNASFYLVQKEQVLILDNSTVFNDVIYSPESGYRQERIKVSAFVSSQWFGGFEVPGFIFDRADIGSWKTWTDYALGDIVYYQGYYYSANKFLPGTSEFDANNWSQIKKPSPALLPNWSYKAGQFEDFYNLTDDNFDSGQQKIAQHLVGYQKRQYLNNIIQDDISEFQFYQGMIREKGTQNSLNKLFDVLSADNKESITFFEEWAIRVGQYGASQAFEAVEFVVTQPDITKNSQGFYLTLQPERSTNFNLNIPANSVYLKPQGYNAKPFPTNNSQKSFLRSAGYVQASSDIIQVKSLESLLTQDITKFKDGVYIWASFANTSWNIYRFTSVKLMPINATYNTNKTITITTTNFVDPSIVGYYIGVQQVSFAGFYKVTEADLTTITLDASTFDPAGDWPTADTIKNNLQIFNLYPVRANSIDDANDIIKSYTKLGDKIWVDNDGENKWASLELTSVFSESEIKKPYTSSDTAHGRVVALSQDGLIAAVATQVGQVIIYEKQGPRWIFKQIITRPFMAQYEFGQDPNLPDTFAETMALSADGQFLAVGNPRAGNLATKVLPNGNVVCDRSALNSSNTLTGTVSLYQKDPYNEFLLLFTIASGDDTTGQQFGSSLEFGTNTLFVGSKGNTNYGTQATVFQLRYLAGIDNTATVANTNADGESATAVVTVTYDAGNAFSSSSSADILFDGGSSLTINSTADRWVIVRPGLSVTNGTSIGYGLSLSVSSDNAVLVIGAPFGGIVYVYKLNSNNVYNLSQTINGKTQVVTQSTTTNGVATFNGSTLDGGYGFRSANNKFTNSTLTNLNTTGGSGLGLIVDGNFVRTNGTLDTDGIIQSFSIRESGKNYRVGDKITVINPLGSGSVLSLSWATRTYTLPADTGIPYKIGDTVNYGGVNYVATGNTTGNTPSLSSPYWSTISFANALVGTDINTTTLLGSGNGLKIRLATAISSGAVAGSTVIPVTKISNFEVGQSVFSSTTPSAFASGTYITQINKATFVSTLSNDVSTSNNVTYQNVLTVSKITAGDNNIIVEIIGSINDTVLTIEALSGGQLIPGMILTGTGVPDSIYIVSGSKNSWIVNKPVSVSSIQITATLYEQIKPGMCLTNPALDTPSTFTGAIVVKGTSTLTGAVTTVIGGVASLYNATISGTSLTFDAVTGGDPVVAGMILTGSGVSSGTTLLYGTGTTWTVSISQTIASPITITATLATATINGYSLTFSKFTGASLQAGAILSGGTVAAGTTIVGGSGTSWTVSINQTATCTTATLPFGTISGNTLTFTASAGAPVEIGMAVIGLTTVPGTFITGGSGTTWTVNINQSTTCTQTTLQAFLVNAEINGTTLTFTDIAGADLIPGMVLSGSTVISGTYVVSGSETEWTVSTSQTVVPTTITGTPVYLTASGTINGTILLGQQLSGSGVAAGTTIVAAGTGSGKAGTYLVTPSQTVSTFSASSRYIYTRPTIVAGITLSTASISGTSLSFSGNGNLLQVGMLITGSNVVPGTTLVSGSSTLWQVSISQSVTSTTLKATGTGTGGTGTYIIDPPLPSSINVTTGISLVINKGLANSFSGNDGDEVTSIKISNPGVGYTLNDLIQFDISGSGNLIKTYVSEITRNATVTITSVSDGSITKDASQFGASVKINTTGEFLSIGSPLYSGAVGFEGEVLVYSNNANPANTYSLYQEIKNPHSASGDLFGRAVSFSNDNKTLLVYSPGADSFISTTFDLDSLQTTFDASALQFKELTLNSGKIDVYTKYLTNWILGESLSNVSNTTDGFGQSFAIANDIILVGAPHATDTLTDKQQNIPVEEINSGKVYAYERIAGKYNWSNIHGQTDLVDLTKIKQVFLYNKSNNKLIRYLDVIDPNYGKIAGTAEQEISYKTFYDPAIYSTGNSTVNVDTGTAWTSSNVSKLWWDLRTAKFVDNHSSDVVYRNSTLNMLATGASIDIYEWIETKLTPAEWKLQADTSTGLTKGISGQPLYTDSYSVKQHFNTFTKAYENTYYFWVKNSVLVPEVSSRTTSAYSVSRLIGNPRGEDYAFACITGNNSFNLINCQNLLSGTDVVLGIEYWIIDNTTQNTHAQWKLIDNNPNTNLPLTIENKWFDSLCGKDQADRPVPDLSLPAKLRFGTESRPRQSMFVNSFEALKEFIERANRILINEQIVEQKDISMLDSYDVAPYKFTGEYDTTVDTDAELRVIAVSTAKPAVISPVIINGSITGITIVSSGSGYINTPPIIVIGSGTGAKLKAIINIAGQITGATILDGGKGYVKSTTTLSVRPFSALVKSDSVANGNWSIYAYVVNATTNVKSWTRVRTQSYNVRNYWNYVDWYATGFNQFTVIDHAIDTFAEIGTINPVVGQTLKVRIAGSRGWQLLHCYSSKASIDWTQQYNVVGIESGTIQLSQKLYDFQNNNIGFDGSTFDGIGYDNTASKELRIILNCLKENILIDTLKQNYLDLFFASIKYAHTEQTYIDWAFKTSFVKAQHNVGNLKQTVTYTNDNLSNFEDYIKEVVPYRTTVREYVSSYSANDNSSSVVTDFDLPAIFTEGGNTVIRTTVKDGVVVSNNEKIKSYPWKHWLDNLGFQVTAITITNPGTGYVTEPLVRIISNSGTGAVARAFIANGKVSRIILLSPGSGYLTAPKIIIDGGSSTGSIISTAVATIGKSLVRSSFIKMKFDRTTSKYYVIQLNETQSFVGGPYNYSLLWAPDIKINASTVKVNGITVLRDSYTLSVVKSTSKGYTSYSGLLKFATGQAPAADSTVTIDYLKDIDLLNASDRIQYFYDPASGQLGKDLNQLMTGVDYGGVIVTGTDYNTASGWESVGFMQDLWDSYENTYNDYIVTIDATTAVSRTFELPYTPEVFTNINIYYEPKITSTYVSDGAKLIYTFVLNYNYIDRVYVSIDKNVAGITKTITATSTETIVVTETVNGFNYLKVSSTANLSVGKAIKFLSGTSGTGFVTGQTYYVKTIDSVANTFTVSSSIGGSTFTVPNWPSSGVGNMVMQYGTSSNYLTSSTTNLYSGMPLQFNGSSLLGGISAGVTYYVSQIVNANNFTISQTSGGPVVPLTSAVGTMSLRQVAASPESTLSLASVAGLKVGDVATTTIDGAIADGTYITKINANSVLLSNILYGDILAGTTITFVRTLNAPVNFRYITNNSLQLAEAPIAGSTLTISATNNAIRIDDPNFDKQWIITNTEATTNIITTITPITFAVGDLITFTGTTFGNINPNTPYYVQNIIDNRHFKISATVGLPGPNPTGVEFKLTSATGSCVAKSTGNATAVMATYIADGLQPIITIPNTYTLVPGDLIIFRKSTSDGSVSVNSNDLDTALDGGSLVYDTATGLAPDDIIIDGDGYVTSTSSGGPEELVQGQIVDAVAIKVFDRPSDGSATLKILSYIADGTNKKFNLEQFPNSSNAVYVKVNSNILTTGTDYTLDYPNKKVVLTTAPAAGSTVTLHSFGFNGTNILDVDYFVSDGKTKEFITKAPYIDTPFTYLVYLDGVAIQPTLFKTDLTYDSPNRIGFRFSIAPNKFQVLNYLIISGTQQTFSIFKTEKIPTNGSSTYTLTNTIGSSLPLESSILVRANQNLLKGPNNNYFIISGNKYDYSLDVLSTQPYSINTTDLTVYADGNLLTLSTDYIVDTAGVTISINRKVYSTYKGKQLIVNVKSAQDYYIVGNTITFTQSYTNVDYVEVVSAYKHDILQIQRTRTKATNNLQFSSESANYYRYTAVLGGRIELSSTISTESQLWVTKNRKLLINGVDYRINPDLASITMDAPVAIDDEFECIIFAGSPVKQGLSYMQFKDILNRTVYKRLNLRKQNILAQDLYYYDSVIYVKDAGNFDKPNPELNKPGIIEINGERIEYFTIKNNTTLGQLRRGTLGTGIPTVHGAGSLVQDIGPGETIPYTDTFKTENTIVDEVNFNKIIPLSFVPNKNTSWTANPSEYGLFDNAVVQKFVSKTGSSPYLITFAVPQQAYAPAVGKSLLVSNNSNTKYNGYYKVSNSDISNTTVITPLSVDSITTVGTSVSVKFVIALQDIAPTTGIYYIVSGATPVEYNSAWLCTASSTTSVTLTFTTNYGVFKILPTSVSATNTITLAYPTDPGTYGTRQITTISAPQYGQANEIEVFVGGYDDSTLWTANTIFVAEQIITINSYAYRITTTHKSGATFNASVTLPNSNGTYDLGTTFAPATSVRTLFVGNIRLKKKPYSVYSVENAPTSPEGDVSFSADFAVDGINAEIVLKNKLSPGTVVTITRKLGQSWTETGVSLQDSQTKIAKFITAVPGVWATSNKTTSTQTTVTATTSFDNVTKSFDNDNTTFDQGN